MKATQFEFRQRVWLIMLLFWGSFGLYAVDRVNVADWAAHRIAPANPASQLLVVRLVFAFSAFLLLLAAGLRTWAAAYLQSTVVHDAQLHAETIVADGPYRYMRNPLYLGGVLLAVGLGFLASRSGFVVIVAGLTILYLRLMGLEESNLEREQGESYREFCRQVPRLWPSLRPRVPSGHLEPKWRQAFFGEMFMWGIFVAVTWFAIALNVRVMWWVFGVTFALWIARIIYYKAKTRAAAQAG
ncbi:MAG TPA: isoprenylcysteine carboxylmethyltransferase family protein [Candidatus Aquilonibacter sp.]|nr:isoprenylcysteine carboxylmethyltransferase family protein [Candidatus Aquilonibacter sp.]